RGHGYVGIAGGTGAESPALSPRPLRRGDCRQPVELHRRHPRRRVGGVSMKSECGMPNAECGRKAAKRRCARAFSSLQPSAFNLQHSSRGITLVELLITMTIIAIISALIMGTAAAAIENAREKRTQ